MELPCRRRQRRAVKKGCPQRTPTLRPSTKRLPRRRHLKRLPHPSGRRWRGFWHALRTRNSRGLICSKSRLSWRIWPLPCRLRQVDGRPMPLITSIFVSRRPWRVFCAWGQIQRRASDRWSLLTDRREPARAGWCVTLSQRLLFAAHVRSPGKTILERSLMISKA